MSKKQRYLYQYVHLAIISRELFEKVTHVIYAVINFNPKEGHILSAEKESAEKEKTAMTFTAEKHLIVWEQGKLNSAFILFPAL